MDGKSRKNLTEEIVKEEWEQFQLVQNEGGRASCQDNRPEFYANRKSQFASWTDEMLESYRNDLEEAKRSGRNLLVEKYAYMMKDTAPEEFEKARGLLPIITERKLTLVQKNVAIQTKWAEEFEKQYPHFSGNGRAIRQTDAQPGEASFETYLRGELMSYGERTNELYTEYVDSCKKKGMNLITAAREKLALAHGFKSLRQAEDYLSQIYG